MPNTKIRWIGWAWTALRHLAVIGVSYWFAWQLRFDFAIPDSEWTSFYKGLIVVVVSKLLISLIGIYPECWGGYQDFLDLVRLASSNLLASVVSTIALYATLGRVFPRSIYCLDFIVCFLLSGGARFATRLRKEMSTRWSSRARPKSLLIYGAGVAGISLAREIRGNASLGYKVIGFLDDDSRKWGLEVMGLPVLGCGQNAGTILEAQRKRGHNIEEIVVAMPSATGRQLRAAVARGKAAGVHTRIVPGLGELLSGRLPIGKMREISVTDLLGRDPVELDLESVDRATAGRSVMVTGAAGSIGTELCMQLAQFRPRILVALDQAESELFRLEADLRSKYPDLNLAVEVGDIRDQHHVEQILEHHAVDSLYHAAAYKHVPLMERQVCEAVRNNVLGTWSLTQAAWRSNVSSFVLISSDKAVNPSSIMGLTKRIAELIVAARRLTHHRGGETKFVSVRFGNVLVSNGSVVPTFSKQISAGGPVTVTHPEMQRFFMTVQEAVQLVLQASTMGRGSEIFVLDMGTPVKIVDLARNMITLAGFVPDEDIDVVFTGLRPGEKLLEELNLEGENIVPTNHRKIRIFQGRQLTFNELVPWIAELQHLIWHRNTAAVVKHMKILVPEYKQDAGRLAVMPPVAVRRPAAETLPAHGRGEVAVFKTAAP